VRRYRFLLVDALGRIREERESHAATDDAAKSIAEKWRGHQPAELWSSHFRIARWR
jgi:hypothetical protein